MDGDIGIGDGGIVCEGVGGKGSAVDRGLDAVGGEDTDSGSGWVGIIGWASGIAVVRVMMIAPITVMIASAQASARRHRGGGDDGGVPTVIRCAVSLGLSGGVWSDWPVVMDISRLGGVACSPPVMVGRALSARKQSRGCGVAGGGVGVSRAMSSWVLSAWRSSRSTRCVGVVE